MIRKFDLLKSIIISIGIVSATLSSCTISRNSRIDGFKEFVGDDIVEGLDLSVELFNSLLQDYYLDSTNSDSMYSAFTEEIINEAVDWNRFYFDSVKLLDYYDLVNNCGFTDELFLKYKGYRFKNSLADSTYFTCIDSIIPKVIEIEYAYIPKDSSSALYTSNKMWILSNSEIENIDSVLLSVKNDIELNMYNRYFRGLELLSNRHNLVSEYLQERKRYHGIDSPLLSLEKWKDIEIDYDDYFYKRIIATEVLLISTNSKYAIQH